LKVEAASVDRSKKRPDCGLCFVQQNGITYILNVSTTSPRPSFIQDGHFLRIPVNDSYCDKLLPFFHESFQFLGKPNFHLV